jgi:hypothetical protein
LYIVSYWDQILFAEEFRQPLKEAWSETRQRIPQLRDALNPQDPRLEQVGLREGQSQHGLKMRVLNALWDRFFSRPTIGGLRGLLGWIDQMLSSLAQVILGLEAVKELKEVIERLITSDEA